MCNTSANFKNIIILDYDCQKDNDKFCMPMLISCKDKIFYGKVFSKLCKKNRFKKLSLLAEVSHDETNRNERRETSAGFRRVSYHACPHVFLTTSDVSVACDTTQRTGLNLSASGC